MTTRRLSTWTLAAIAWPLALATAAPPAPLGLTFDEPSATAPVKVRPESKPGVPEVPEVPGVSGAPAAPEAPEAEPLQFSLTYDSSVTDSFTGIVYVMMAASESYEPRLGPEWFSTNPFFSMEVKDWKPDTPLVFGEDARGYPGPISTVPNRMWSIQAVMRRNLDSPSVGEGEGDACSRLRRRKLGGADGGRLDLSIDQLVGADEFEETDRIKLIDMRSELLSAFHGREVRMRAAVVLPEHYDKDPERLYPALYWIGGFGSDHHAAASFARRWDETGAASSIVRVVLDPQCYGGHHVFADSDNNGPVGRALVEEFIPHLEQIVRLAANPAGRFLSGHSSGGWSALWLQIAYPDFFGGVWSISPDPVDFRNFQRINLYQPGVNMYVDEAGERRPLARRGGQVFCWYDDFAKMDYVVREGGQLRSFEWVFSRRGPDGKPIAMFDRTTGAVDPAVAESWKRYDIDLILRNNWLTLEPKLAGKLHVFMGELDTFYLEGATRLLKDALAELKSDAVVELVPGRDHGTVISPSLRRRIDTELLAIFDAKHPKQPVASP